ncbi:hypothetical protein JCM18382A_50660 [Bradyrhizobium sp. 17-4]
MSKLAAPGTGNDSARLSLPSNGLVTKNEASVSARRRLIGMVHGSLRDRDRSRAWSVREDELEPNGVEPARPLATL